MSASELSNSPVTNNSGGRDRRRVSIIALLMIASAISVALAQQYPTTLQYLPRGDRSEGLVAAPKSAAAMVLVSAVAKLAVAPEPLPEWPESLHLRFYLPRDGASPSVRIRQLSSFAGYYQMDSVVPAKPWVSGAVNDFTWNRDVIAGIYDYQAARAGHGIRTKDLWLAGLGIVVSLGPSGAEGGLQNLTVAPALLDYSNRRPLSTSRYEFTFRTNAAARVTGAIRSPSNTEVLAGINYQVTSGDPFTIKWDLKNTPPEGWYRLMLETSFEGQPQFIVRFYHANH